ncbi:MAG: hypothetical protein J6M12_05395 [Clostridia bacterium]|nr:hypothetical protein [Clostridia bacterium]
MANSILNGAFNKNKRKALVLSGLLLGVVLLMVCCDSLPGEVTEDDVPGQAQSEGKISEYILVRGDSSGNEVLRQVLALKDAIDDRFGSNVRSSTDWAVDAEDAKVPLKEILVGETNREESISVNEELKGVNGYVIRTVNEKIVITASTTGLLAQAVDRFAKEYINDSEEGNVPDNIDIRYTAELPLCVMSDPTCMKIVLSDRAEQTTRKMASDFATRIEELSGQFPLIEFSGDLSADKVAFTFKDPLFVAEEKDPSGKPEAEGNTMWTLSKEGDQVTLQGKGPLQLSAGFAGLYEILEARMDRTLDGQTVFFYEKSSIRKESWQAGCPRVIGATYLGSESISNDSMGWYYENVSFNDLRAWKALIVEDSFGPCVVSIETHDRASYLNHRDNVEIQLYYSSEARTLMVTERTLS